MNYITKVIDTLQLDNFYGATENIEIAKGKYQLVRSWKGFVRKLKRTIHGN